MICIFFPLGLLSYMKKGVGGSLKFACHKIYDILYLLTKQGELKTNISSLYCTLTSEASQ